MTLSLCLLMVALVRCCGTKILMALLGRKKMNTLFLFKVVVYVMKQISPFLWGLLPTLWHNNSWKNDDFFNAKTELKLLIHYCEVSWLNPCCLTFKEAGSQPQNLALVDQLPSSKVSFLGLCSKMQIMPIKNLNIKKVVPQFLWFFRLKCWFKGQITSRI